jgi:hypothetical protein
MKITSRLFAVNKQMKKFLLLVVLIPVLSLQSCAWIAPSRQVHGKVTMTERITTSESSHYRVYMTGGEVFVNIDAIEIGKFNSSSLQSLLNEAYQNQNEVCVEVYGWRIPWLSMFENVRGFCN